MRRSGQSEGLQLWRTTRASVSRSAGVPSSTRTPPPSSSATSGGPTRELNQLTNRVAHGLHALGVNPGDRVGFLGLNHPRFFFTLFAAAKLDAIFVPLNFRLTGPELSFIIRDAGLHTLVYEEAFASIVELDPRRPERARIRLRRRAERRARLRTRCCTISATPTSTTRSR